MGFQHELYEIDLERGDGAAIIPPKNASRSIADTAVSWGLLLLLLANIFDPLGRAGCVLGVLSLLASLLGVGALLHRRPLGAASKKVLILLPVCWIIFGTRLYFLNARRTGPQLSVNYVSAVKAEHDSSSEAASSQVARRFHHAAQAPTVFHTQQTTENVHVPAGLTEEHELDDVRLGDGTNNNAESRHSAETTDSDVSA